MSREPAPGATRAGRSRALLCRMFLGAVFVGAGTAKFLEPPQGFADSVASFRLVPVWLVSPLTLALPPCELLVGIALLVDRPRRLGAYGALMLAGVFLAALLAALVRGIPVDCGCFGAGASWLPLSGTQRVWFDLGRDLVLAVLALGLYRHQAEADHRTVPP